MVGGVFVSVLQHQFLTKTILNAVTVFMFSQQKEGMLKLVAIVDVGIFFVCLPTYRHHVVTFQSDSQPKPQSLATCDVPNLTTKLEKRYEKEVTR